MMQRYIDLDVLMYHHPSGFFCYNGVVISADPGQQTADRVRVAVRRPARPALRRPHDATHACMQAHL